MMLEKLWSAISPMSAPVATPPGFNASVPASEQEDVPGGAPDFSSSPITGYACVIRYRSTAGEISVRRITCLQLTDAAGQTYLRARCHERKAVRTFKLTGVVEVVDALTGEVLDPAVFFAQFQTEQRSIGLNWGLHVRRKAELVAGLNALVFMGRCDRDWHPLEREVVERFVASFWLHHELPHDPPLDEILHHAERLAPDAEAFFTALMKAEESAFLRRQLRRHLQAMVDADGAIRPEEAYWGAAVDEFFREMETMPPELRISLEGPESH